MNADDYINNAVTRMDKSLESLDVELAKLRTGRAHPGLVENVLVDSYGSEVPLKQVASIVAEDALTLVVSVWDKSQSAQVEKAIVNADLGLNPVVNGAVIRVPLPALTQERRDQLAKLVKSSGENAKVAIRNIRRDLLSEFKQLKKDKAITEDDERSLGGRAQELTDKYIAKVDKIVTAKETELQTI